VIISLTFEQNAAPQSWHQSFLTEDFYEFDAKGLYLYTGLIYFI